jgi:hypothetical protein
MKNIYEERGERSEDVITPMTNKEHTGVKNKNDFGSSDK